MARTVKVIVKRIKYFMCRIYEKIQKVVQKFVIFEILWLFKHL